MAQQPPAPIGPQPTTAVPHYVQQPGGPIVTAPPTNQLAIVSLAAGIASYVLLPVIGALVAIITGHMARSQIKRTGEGGKGYATAGLILGYAHLAIGLVVGLIVVIAVLGFLGFVASQHPNG